MLETSVSTETDLWELCTDQSFYPRAESSFSSSSLPPRPRVRRCHQTLFRSPDPCLPLTFAPYQVSTDVKRGESSAQRRPRTPLFPSSCWWKSGIQLKKAVQHICLSHVPAENILSRMVQSFSHTFTIHNSVRICYPEACWQTRMCLRLFCFLQMRGSEELRSECCSAP